jgi:alkylated DNA repair protein (DNA oxidative demethylase)
MYRLSLGELSSMKTEIIDAPDGFSYIESFLTSAQHDSLLTEVEALQFARDRFRGQQLKRTYAQFGYTYLSTGRKLRQAPPFPGFLTGLVEKAAPHCPQGATFDQCIVARYPAGAGIGWHTDAHRFGDCIIAVSQSGPARLQFRTKGRGRQS